MIRVNLLRNRVGDAGAAVNAGVVTESSSANSGVARDVIVRVVLIGMGVAGLMTYESRHRAELLQEQARLQNQANELTQQAATKSAEAESVKDIEAQAKELEDKLKVLKLLSRLRLREVKTLDFMQSSIPEKVWLKSVHYEAPKEQPETGHFVFQGNAVTTEELTEFAKRLENSAYLSDVIVVKNQEIAPSKNLLVRDFQFTAEVEQQASPENPPNADRNTEKHN